MGQYLIRRILALVPMIFGVTVIVFIVMNILPGDPAILIAGDQASAATVQRIREDLGLDRPVLIRYVDWVTDMLRGDFGRSLKTRQPVLDIMADAVPATVELTFVAALIMLPVGIGLGVLAAAYRGSALDLLATIIGSVGIAVPNFWLALLLVNLFSLQLRILPSAGFVPVWEDPASGLRYLVMPGIVLAAPGIAVLTRQTRAAVIEVLSQDYVRTARSKGLNHHTVLVSHALRNALLPVIAIVGLQLALLIGGSVIVETVFAIPGMGRLVVDSIFFRDYPVVQAVVLLMVTLVLLLNILVDIAYAVADPRIKLSGGR
jgi:peptide/nickel transport system permease protein